MATEEVPERKARKSVAFTDQKVVVDVDGSVNMVDTQIDDSKEGDTAQSHAPRTPPLSAALGAFTDTSQAPADDASALDLTLEKKKKKKKMPELGDGEEATGAAGEDASGLDLSNLKKKKKKPKLAKDDEFAAKLKALDLEGKDGDEADEPAQIDEGDMDKGTGIWEHDLAAPNIPFSLLLNRFFKLLEEKNPDHAASGTRSYKIPPPQCLREGNKKTIFANIAEIAKRMKRSDEHVTAFLFAELGTSGSVDGARRLVIKGRFQQKQIEAVLKRYIIDYVACRTCRSPDTELSRGENRLYFLECNACGSRRSVTAIKTGFSAQIGKRKKQG